MSEMTREEFSLAAINGADLTFADLYGADFMNCDLRSVYIDPLSTNDICLHGATGHCSNVEDIIRCVNSD